MSDQNTHNIALDDEWDLGGASTTTTATKVAYEDLSEEQKASAATPSKACLLSDPDCEACQ